MFVMLQLAQDPSTPRTIDFPEPVYCSVSARLGEEKQGPYENFIPLTVVNLRLTCPPGLFPFLKLGYGT